MSEMYFDIVLIFLIEKETCNKISTFSLQIKGFIALNRIHDLQGVTSFEVFGIYSFHMLDFYYWFRVGFVSILDQSLFWNGLSRVLKKIR